MNRAAFRRFEFFDVETVAPNIANSLGSVPTCAVAESGMLIFGDELGNIIFSDREFKLTEKRYKIFNGEVIDIAYVFDPVNHSRQYIIAIGDDSKPAFDPTDPHASTIGTHGAPVNLIKVYNVADMIHPIHVLNATVTDTFITGFAVLSDSMQIAVGYSNGRIQLFSGIILREAATRSLSPTILLQEHFAGVSCLYFSEFSSSKNPELRKIKLFAVMDTKHSDTVDDDLRPMDQEDIEHAGIIVFDTSMALHTGKNAFILASRSDPIALDDKGASKLCCCYMKNTAELVIARSEAIYTYTIDDRGGAIAIFGDKFGIHCIGRYTLIVSQDEKPVNSEAGKIKKSSVHIYDLKNKFICGTNKKYFLPNNDKLSLVVSDGGLVYLITANGLMVRFSEKDTQNKLRVLLEQMNPPLYSLAITLAAEEQMDAFEIMKLYKEYGDHLYSKHEYEASIAQYCNTIGYIPPSYVIIKFLDPYRIHNLISYLEKIREKGLAGSNHIILLLSCYAKSKNEEKIVALLESIYSQAKANTENAVDVASAFRKASGNSINKLHPTFDALQAIRILQGAGYLEIATKVAIKYQQHQMYMKIQLSKTPPQIDEAIGYLAYCAFVTSAEEMIALLETFGNQLLTSKPKQFTNLMIKICSGTLETLLAHSNMETGSSGTPSPSKKSSKSLDGVSIPNFLKSLQSTMEMKLNASQGMLVSLLDVLPIYADDKDNLMSLIEGVISLCSGMPLPSKVWLTLAELYMHQYMLAKNERLQAKEKQLAKDQIEQLEDSLQSWEVKAMSVIDGANVQYELSDMLLLCHIYGFQRGERFVLEKQNNIELVITQMMESNNGKDLFKLLRREGTKDPELFIQVLTYLVKQSIRNEGIDSDEYLAMQEEEEEEDSSKWDSIMDVVELIEKENILAPAQVLSILAMNPKLPMQVIADYIQNCFKELSESVALVEDDVREAQRNLELVTVSSQAQSEMLKGTRKEKAGKKRFDGYDDEDDEDDDEEEVQNTQKKEQDKWISIRRSQIECSQDHEAFYKELELSTDGFSTVAGYFGRSLII